MKPYLPQELSDIAEAVARGKRPQVSVRALLSWFGYRRRGRWRMQQIREALNYLNLDTFPDLDWPSLHGTVHILKKNEANAAYTWQIDESGELVPPKPPPTAQQHAETREASFTADAYIVEAPKSARIRSDPTFRIGRLEIASRKPVSVKPETTIQEAITIMLKNDYSQLPVMSGERTVKGIFGWKSYGSRRSLGYECTFVKEALDEHCEISADASLFSVVELMKQHDCVLIRDSVGTVSGILTPYDISVTFGQLGEPFLLLGEIENHIRDLIEGKFTSGELAAMRDVADAERTVKQVSDLTFGEYARLLQNPDNWQRLGFHIDRVAFVKDLEEIRQIRNDVMHFDPDGIDESDLEKLRTFVRFLQRIRRIKGQSSGQTVQVGAARS